MTTTAKNYNIYVFTPFPPKTQKKSRLGATRHQQQIKIEMKTINSFPKSNLEF